MGGIRAEHTPLNKALVSLAIDQAELTLPRCIESKKTTEINVAIAFIVKYSTGRMLNV